MTQFFYVIRKFLSHNMLRKDATLLRDGQCAQNTCRQIRHFVENDVLGLFFQTKRGIIMDK